MHAVVGDVTRVPVGASAQRRAVSQVPTPLVGREVELAALRAELADPQVRLLTVTGPVGAGKSRLAIAAAESLLAETGASVHVIDLAAMAADAGPLLELPRAALTSRQPVAGPFGRLDTALAGRAGAQSPVLLLLDNCDVVVDVLADEIAGLLAADPTLTVLATSREPLRVYGERRFAVAPLPVPAAGLPAAALEQVPSVALFVQRARAASPGFALSDDNRDAVAEICRQLDGLPLGIELAAARVRLFQPRALLQRLTENLDVLEARSADTLSQHRSMRAAIEASYLRLGPEEQAVIRRLAVFPGGFGLQAVEAVVGPTTAPVHRLLETLLDVSLLTARETCDGEPQFRLLRTVRAIAYEQLRWSGEEADCQRRQADYVRGIAERASAALAGARERPWLASLAAERETIAEVVRWLLRDGDGPAAVTLLGQLLRYWVMQGQVSEARRWVAEAVAACESADDLPATAAAQRLSGVLAAAQGELEGAAAALRRAVELHRVLGDDTGLADSLAHLGLVATRVGDTSTARVVLQEALVLATRRGDRATRALVLMHTAAALATDGDAVGATARATEAARLFTEMGDRRELARTRSLLARVAAERCQPDRAVDLARSALRVQWEIGDRAELPATLEVVADLLSTAGGAQPQAAVLLGAAAALRELAQVHPSPAERAAAERTTSRLRGRLGASVVAEATAQGRRASLPEVVERALHCRMPLPGAASRQAAGTAPLTPREQEVAALITRGLTNRQIARRLGIAEWTAVNHVRHIMRKLDCPSRIHVAQLMARHG
jgi:predicted ATPase/DNA-binding CsgD family transcriptional regulator